MSVFVWDIVIALVLVLLLERRMLGANYLLFSPVQVFVLSVGLVYVFPIILWAHFPDISMSVSENEVRVLVSGVRLFVYTTVAVVMLLLPWISSRPCELLRYRVGKGLVVALFAAFVGAFTLNLTIGVPLDPSILLARLIRPRDFTFVREGTGPVVVSMQFLCLSGVFSVLLAAASGVLKKRSAYALAAVMLLLALVSGIKFLFFATVLFLLWASWKMFGSRPGVLTGVVFCLVLLGLLGFTFNSLQSETLRDRGTLVDIYADYQREAVLSAKVMAEYEWQAEHLEEAIVGTLISPVPRFVWAGKPVYGYYDKYWRPVFDAGTEQFHTTTFGSLAEAHMLLGLYGPFAYGLVFGLLVAVLYRNLVASSSVHGVFTSMFVCAFLYFLVRGGLLFTSLWYVVLFGLASLVLFRGVAPAFRQTGRRHVQEI
jgi:hypothetical protein